MKLPVVSIEGKELRNLEVDDSVFGITPNGPVLHQAYVRQRNNQRAGTVKTKSRGEVQGSTRKIRQQKGSGRARQGSARAPHRVGGGVAFGPRPRDYSQDMPKKMRRLAIRSALSGKVADGQLVIIDQLAFEKPQTKEIMRILNNVGFMRSALVVTASSDRSVIASVRNLEKTMALPAAYLNVADMMNHAGILITEEAVRIAESLWGQKDASNAPTKAKRTASPEEEAPAREITGRAVRRAAEKVAHTARVDAAAVIKKVKKDKADAAAKEAAAKGKAPKGEAAAAPDGDDEAVVEAKVEAKAKAVVETVAEAPAEVTAPEAAAPAAEEKPKRAPKAKKEAPEAAAEAPAAEATAEPATEEKPKTARKAPATKAKAAKPKPAAKPKAEKPAADKPVAKPKRATKKKEEGE